MASLVSVSQNVHSRPHAATPWHQDGLWPICCPCVCSLYYHQRLLCVRRQRLTERFIACKVLKPLLSALVYIHERNIVHR